MSSQRICTFTKSTVKADGSSCREELKITCIEVLQPSYGMYLWPCAPVLAQYVWWNKDQVNNKHILEIGAGTALPGIVSSKVGAASVTLTDASTLPACLRNCQLNVTANQLEDVHVIGLTWGLASPQLVNLNPDIILASDCFYDPADFDDILFTISLLLERNKNAECWSTYQVRSLDWTIEDKLESWNLRCRNIPLADFNAGGTDVAGSRLPGNHSIHMQVITAG